MYVKNILLLLLLESSFFCSKATITEISIPNARQAEAKIVSVVTDYDSLNTTGMNPEAMNFLPNLEDTQTLTLTLNTTSQTAPLPRTVQLAVYACVTPVKLKTAGQLQPGKNQN
jgi:hypothetical protein